MRCSTFYTLSFLFLQSKSKLNKRKFSLGLLLLLFVFALNLDCHQSLSRICKVLNGHYDQQESRMSRSNDRCNGFWWVVLYGGRSSHTLETYGSSVAEGREREREMENIEHRRVEVNGIKMHVAEKGEGPLVLFLHGFPELWYSWRHQILALSSKGYRAVAPDLRGYGDTEAPASVTSYTCFHIVGDIVALIDSLGVDKVFLVGHDWGAIIGWYLCLFRPERIKAYVCLSVPFRPFLGRNPKVKTVDAFHSLYGDDYYICRFQEPGKMEAELDRVDTAYLLKNILTTRKTGPPIFPKGEYGTGFNPDTPDALPSWLSEEDLNYYVSKFKNTGFTGGLNYYRNLNLNWELTAPWTGVGIENVPVKFIVGSVDLVYTSPGMKEYIHNGGFKKDVPTLEEVVVQEGIAHFNNQEAAEDVSNHIYDFINKY